MTGKPGRLASAAAGLLVWLSVSAANAAEHCDLYFSGGVILKSVPVARSKPEQARGLSRRVDVGPGMLFSWDRAEARVIWMRDTPVPLTVAFFDADGLLFAIEDMAPNTDEYHFSGGPALDALELAQGQFSRLGLAQGSRLLRRECFTSKP